MKMIRVELIPEKRTIIREDAKSLEINEKQKRFDKLVNCKM